MDSQKEYANVILRKESADLTNVENINEILKEILIHVEHVLHQIRSFLEIETQQIVVGCQSHCGIMAMKS